MSMHFSMVAAVSMLNQIFFIALTALSLQQPKNKSFVELKKNHNINLNLLQKKCTSRTQLQYKH